jgi:transcriptional regulator with PAS, ATPase and Fis domain
LNYLFPNIDSLIQDDFILLDEVSEKTDLSQYKYIFHKDDEYYSVLPINDYLFYKKQSIQCLFWKPVSTFLENESIDNMLKSEANEIVAILDSNKRIKGYIFIAALLKQTFSAYQSIKALFETTVDTIDSSVSIVTTSGKTIAWTKGAEKIFSIRKEDILGNDMAQFFPEHMLLNKVSMQTGQVIRHQQHKPREDLFVMINVSPVKVDGEIIGAVAAETDMTSQVLMSQELMNASSTIHKLQKEVTQLKSSQEPFKLMKGSSKSMEEVIEISKKMAKTKSTILLLGETGVGKEVLSKAIHDSSSLQEPFIAINCGAITGSLFESELFGYEKGAFSGADKNGKVGKIELAGDGTLFLDEIGDLPLDLQVKLLRVLENKTYYQVGGTKLLNVSCRIIAATNKDLDKMVEKGEFREDLLYRLNTLTITIPPLRDRKQDLLELLHMFIQEFSIIHQRQIKYIDPTVTKAILSYDWPGNIRELKNLVERLVILSDDGIIINSLLPEKMKFDDETNQSTLKTVLQDEIQSYEKMQIISVLQSTNGNKQEAAKKMGVSRATLYNKLKKHGI